MIRCQTSEKSGPQQSKYSTGVMRVWSEAMKTPSAPRRAAAFLNLLSNFRRDGLPLTDRTISPSIVLGLCGSIGKIWTEAGFTGSSWGDPKYDCVRSEMPAQPHKNDIIASSDIQVTIRLFNATLISNTARHAI